MENASYGHPELCFPVFHGYEDVVTALNPSFKFVKQISEYQSVVNPPDCRCPCDFDVDGEFLVVYLSSVNYGSLRRF